MVGTSGLTKYVVHILLYKPHPLHLLVKEHLTQGQSYDKKCFLGAFAVLKVATELQWTLSFFFIGLMMSTSRYCGQVPVEVHYQIV